VSSTLRLHALRTEDTALMEESGYVELIHYLQRDVVGHADDLDRRSVSQDVLAVSQQLAASMQSELIAQEDPEKAAGLIEQLKEAKQKADDLRQRSARWQQTLNDGVQDLTSDIEYDLRDRLRSVSREAEHVIDQSDPKDTWDQFTTWFEQQVSQSVTQNFVWTIQRTQYLATQVAEHFSENGSGQLPELNYGQKDFQSELAHLEKPDLEVVGIGSKLFTGVRGGYSGFVMGGMAMGLAGISMLNPLSVGAGLLFGGKTLHDDLKRNKQRRQADAKQAMRRHIDDTTFQVGRDVRDMLRQLQRTLRDHFSSVAEEMSTSLADAVMSAQKAVQTVEGGRATRIRDLRAELERIDNMAQRAKALDPVGSQAAFSSGGAALGAGR
jgi:hypothetical protein